MNCCNNGVDDNAARTMFQRLYLPPTIYLLGLGLGFLKKISGRDKSFLFTSNFVLDFTGPGIFSDFAVVII